MYDSYSMNYKIKALTNTLTKKKEENTEICNQIKEVRGTAERAQKENKVLDGRLTKIQNELQSQEMMNKCNFYKNSILRLKNHILIGCQF